LAFKVTRIDPNISIKKFAANTLLVCVSDPLKIITTVKATAMINGPKRSQSLNSFTFSALEKGNSTNLTLTIKEYRSRFLLLYNGLRDGFFQRVELI
jgi:hypothetical protein